MIVACERCQTRFQLDDARVPANGIRVRCSRCKHAFVVRRPGGSEDDTIHGIALSAAEDAQATPQVTSDLDVTRAAAAPSVAAAPAPGDDEDWTFNEPMPDPRGESGRSDARRASLDAASRGVAPAPRSASLGEPDERSLEAIGSPESWDFGVPEPVTSASGDAGANPDPGAPAAEPAGGDASAAPRTAAVASSATAETRAPRAEVAPRQRAVLRIGRLPLTGAGDALRWGASALLLAMLAAVSLFPRTPPRPALVAPATRLGGVVVDGARGHLVDNAVAGPLLVVSATLRNDGDRPASAGAAVVVTLTGVEGIEASAARRLAGVAPVERRLRESLPAAIQDEIAGSATELGARMLAPGESLAIAAVFPALPRALGGIAIEGGDQAPAARAPEGAAASPEGAGAATSAASLP